MPSPDAPYVPQPPAPGMSAAMKALIAVVTGVLVFAGVYFAVQANAKRVSERAAMEELKQAQREVAADMKRDLEQNGGISADTSAKAMDRARAQMEKIASSGGKEEKAAMEVLSELQAVAAPSVAIMKRIETDNPMDMLTVKEKSDLTERRNFGKEVLTTNQTIIAFFDTAETRLQEKLLKAGVPEASAKRFVAGFMAGFSRSSAIQRRIRKSDEAIANALIAMTDLLEADWGKWRGKDGRMIFDDDKDAEKYNGLADAVTKAAAEQLAAQRELLELQQRR